MKRTKPSNRRVRRVTPWVWRTCVGCEQQFKLEPGWKVVEYFRRRVAMIYVCGGCAATASEASRHVVREPPQPPVALSWSKPAPPCNHVRREGMTEYECTDPRRAD